MDRVESLIDKVIEEKNPHLLCKNYRVDDDTCRSGCPKEGIRRGDACTFSIHPEEDDGKPQYKCVCYRR